MNQFNHLLAKIFIAIISSPLAFAEPLAVYKFEAPTPTVPEVSESAAPHCKVSEAAWNVPEADQKTFGFGGKLSTAYLNKNVAPRKYDPNVYLTFTVTADDGHRIDLDALAFRFGATTSEGYLGSDFPVFCRVFSDAQNPPFSAELPFAAPRAGGEAVCEVSPVPAPEGVYTDVRINLAGAEFQDREQITFRLAIYCPERSNGIFLRFGQIALEGSVKRL